jgi:hypothetical protein
MIRDFDELRDLAIGMTNALVEQGFLEDCMDTDSNVEFDVQDLLLETLIDSLRQDDCITPKGVVLGNVELKEINEDYRIAFISVDDIPLGIFTLFTDEEQEDRLYVTIDYEVTYVDNLI